MTAMGKTCDRWVSMNEPRTFCTEGYSAEPESAPGHKGTIDDVYTCMHHALLAHGRAYKVYKELETKGVVHGGFGIKLDGGPGIPFDPNSDKDKHAVRRHSAFVSVSALLVILCSFMRLTLALVVASLVIRNSAGNCDP